MWLKSTSPLDTLSPCFRNGVSRFLATTSTTRVGGNHRRPFDYWLMRCVTVNEVSHSSGHASATACAAGANIGRTGLPSAVGQACSSRLRVGTVSGQSVCQRNARLTRRTPALAAETADLSYSLFTIMSFETLMMLTPRRRRACTPSLTIDP